MSISVCMIDDHALIRHGISLILSQTKDISLSDEYGCINDAISVINTKAWDILLLDISLPDTNGMDGIQAIREASPNLPILILTMHNETQFGVRAMQLGANGYLTKDKASIDLLIAIRTIMNGKKYIGPEFSEMLAMNMFNKKSNILHERLSNREFDVLLLLAEGKTPTEIGHKLFLSIKTISTYRIRILEKLQLNNNAELVRYCIDHNLIQ